MSETQIKMYKFDKKPRDGSSILYVKCGYREGALNPPVEVKFDFRETALHVRSAFVQVKKANVIDLGLNEGTKMNEKNVLNVTILKSEI